MRRTPRDPDTVNLATKAASSSANFTFVNQAEDIASLSHRKINDVNQRHAIRSHVMQRVRQEELAQGKKRPTGREHPKRSSKISIRSRSSDSDSSSKTEHLPQSIAIKQEPGDSTSHSLSLEVLAPRISPPSRQFRQIQLNVAPAVHEFDPFQTLPTHGLPHSTVESMLQYCFDTLLPMTFAMEALSHSECMARRGMVLRSKANSPAVFLGFMATVAAHRAILRGYHKDLAPSDANHDDLITDPDYKRVKHHTIVAVREMIEDHRGPNQYLIDACFGLVSIATVVGNFREARVHLQGIARMISMIGTSEESTEWLPITNVKIATAMLSPPPLPIPWERQPVPADLLQKVLPDLHTQAAKVGSSFCEIVHLSGRIKQLLTLHAELCQICDFHATNPTGLSAVENGILSRKATELEYDFVAYPYEHPVMGVVPDMKPAIQPLEAVVRLAALGLLYTTPHSILPATGAGRALTYHQRQALTTWFREQKADYGRNELLAVMWALFVFVQCSESQPEASIFTEQLSSLLHELWFIKWSQVEAALSSFLYMPALQLRIWNNIFQSALQLRLRHWSAEDGSPLSGDSSR